MVKFTERKLKSDDPIFKRGVLVFVPIARPRKGDTPVPTPLSMVTVDLEFVGEKLESFYAAPPKKAKRTKNKASEGQGDASDASYRSDAAFLRA